MSSPSTLKLKNLKGAKNEIIHLGDDHLVMTENEKKELVTEDEFQFISRKNEESVRKLSLIWVVAFAILRRVVFSWWWREKCEKNMKKNVNLTSVDP